jgi:CRP/FNR family transcriptional regulator
MPLPRLLSCSVCGHRAHGLFCGLAGQHLDTLDRARIVQRYERGQPICDQGDPANALFCVFSGSVELYKIGPGDTEVTIRLLRPGDVVGYRPMLADEPLAASARALENTTLCVIPRNTVFDLLRNSPETAMRLLQKLAQELRVSEEELVARVSQSVPQRVARFLLWLREGLRNHPGNGLDIDVSLRREDMAHVIGIAPETLSRVLHDLERRGIVQLDRRRIRILDLPRLQQLSAPDPPALMRNIG